MFSYVFIAFWRLEVLEQSGVPLLGAGPSGAAHGGDGVGSGFLRRLVEAGLRGEGQNGRSCKLAFFDIDFRI